VTDPRDPEDEQRPPARVGLGWSIREVAGLCAGAGFGAFFEGMCCGAVFQSSVTGVRGILLGAGVMVLALLHQRRAKVGKSLLLGELPQHRLARLVAANSPEVWRDPAAGGRLLHEALAKFPREAKWLRTALEQGVVAELTDKRLENVTVPLVERLVREGGLTREAASWAVDAWSQALGPARLPARLQPPCQGPAGPPVECLEVGPVRCIAVSADGQRLLTGARDGTVRVWNLATGNGVGCLEGFDGPVHGVAFSPDGLLAVACGAQKPRGEGKTADQVDSAARVWDLTNGREVRRLQATGAMWAVAVSPDGRQVLIAGAGRLRVWDLDSGEQRALLRHAINWFNEDQVRSVAYSPGGAWAATGCELGQHLRLWNLRTGEEVRRYMGHGKFFRLAFRHAAVVSVAFSPEGDRLLSGSLDQTARVWDTVTGEQLARFDGHRGLFGWRGVTGVAFCPDGARALSGSEDGSVRLWDAETGAERARFDHGARVRALAVLPDGTHALSAGRDGLLRAWRLPGPAG
jgi:hypothetical protein